MLDGSLILEIAVPAGNVSRPEERHQVSRCYRWRRGTWTDKSLAQKIEGLGEEIESLVKLRGMGLKIHFPVAIVHVLKGLYVADLGHP